jgi:hypothetical protein
LFIVQPKELNVHEYQLRAVLAAMSRDGKLSVIAATAGFPVDRIERFIDGKKITPQEVVVLRAAVSGFKSQPAIEPIHQKFAEFAKAYKYDLDHDGEDYVRDSTRKAFVAFKNGFETSSEIEAKASKLWDLLHELAPFVPADFQAKVQTMLDAGI